MSTDAPENRELITELSRIIVSEVADEELPLFDELLKDYFDSPTPPDPSEAASDDPLAFGLGGLMIGTTPAAAALATTVLTFVVTEGLKIAKDETVELLKKKIKGAFESDEEQGDEGPSPLTEDQLKRIKKQALNWPHGYMLMQSPKKDRRTSA